MRSMARYRGAGVAGVVASVLLLITWLPLKVHVGHLYDGDASTHIFPRKRGLTVNAGFASALGLCDRTSKLVATMPSKAATAEEKLAAREMFGRLAILHDVTGSRYARIPALNRPCAGEFEKEKRWPSEPSDTCTGLLLDGTTMITAEHCTARSRATIGYSGDVDAELVPGKGGIVTFEVGPCVRVFAWQTGDPLNPECVDAAICPIRQLDGQGEPLRLPRLERRTFDPTRKTFYASHMFGMRAMRNDGPIRLRPGGVRHMLSAPVDLANGSSGSPVVQVVGGSVVVVGVLRGRSRSDDVCVCGDEKAPCKGCADGEKDCERFRVDADRKGKCPEARFSIVAVPEGYGWRDGLRDSMSCRELGKK
jgi:hypothetical protein